MPWDKTHKQHSKQRILDSAAFLFTHQGFNKVSINDVMQHAGMTRGAFYNHFKSKTDLYAQAVSIAAQSAHQHLIAQQGFELECLVQGYLQQQFSDQHLCPLAFLTNDIAHNDAAIHHSYTQTFKAFLNSLDTLGLSQDKALQAAVLLIGGVAIANSLDDETLQAKLIKTCQQAILGSSQDA